MATRTSTRTRRTTKKAEPEPEVDEDELEDLEDDEVEETPKRRTAAKKAPAKKAPAKAEKEVLGTAWLKEHVNDTLGTSHESTKLRIILRKLIKDGTIESPKDGRYVFTGPRDPNVKAIIAALKDEAKAGPTKRGRKPKAKAAVEEVEDDEVEDLDLDDDDE
mgnify:FL=1